MKRPENTIADFITNNRFLFEDMKEQSPEIDAATKEVLKQLFVKFTGTPAFDSKEEDPYKEIERYKDLFSKNKIIENLPPYLKYLALENQLLQNRTKDSSKALGQDKDDGNFNWKDSFEHQKSPGFFAFVNDLLWDSEEILLIIGSYENLLTTPQTPEEIVAKSWTAEDLIGKFIKWQGSGKIYQVYKLVRNNPKNKLYAITCVSDTVSPDTEYSLDMTEISKLLDGKDYHGMKLVSDPQIVDKPKSEIKPEQITSTLDYFPVEMYPSESIYITKNTGDRPSPTQSAGEWYKKGYEKVLVRGNDGIWYKAFPNKQGVARWTKTDFEKPIDERTTTAFGDEIDADYSTWDLSKLNHKIGEIATTLSVLEKTDPEYIELKVMFDDIKEELEKRKEY